MFYRITLQILSGFAGIVFITKSLFVKKERDVLSQRVSCKNLQASEIWIHAASVGEVSGIAPLVESLSVKYPDKKILITTTSITGQEEILRRKFKCNSHLLPLDIPFLVEKFVSKINPELVIIAETEIWPNLFLSLQNKKIPLAIINGRISDKSFPRYRIFKKFFSPLLSEINLVMVQSETDRKRFIEIGCSPDSVFVNGSTKYDTKASSLSVAESQQLKNELGLSVEVPCFVAGSVRPGEDSQVLEAYLLAKKRIPNLQLVIAPRHPEKFAEVADLLSKNNLTFCRRSEGVPKKEFSVVLLDTLGELGKVYGVAEVSFVGGTLVNIGGHNPFEPIAMSSAVLIGPYSHNARDAVSQLKMAGGIIEVSSGKNLAEAIIKLVSNEDLRKQQVIQGQLVLQNNLGATERALSKLDKCVFMDQVSSVTATNQINY